MVKFTDIKGFVFDLDGVVTDTSRYHAKAWGQLADKLGVDYPGLGDAVKGISRMDALEMILKKVAWKTTILKPKKKRWRQKKCQLCQPDPKYEC